MVQEPVLDGSVCCGDGSWDDSVVELDGVGGRGDDAQLEDTCARWACDSRCSASVDVRHCELRCVPGVSDGHGSSLYGSHHASVEVPKESYQRIRRSVQAAATGY